MDHYTETLRVWARGDFYPLERDEHDRSALDDLADEIEAAPAQWWPAFKALLEDADRETERNLVFPMASLLHFGGEAMRKEFAAAARTNRKLANAFWDGMEDLRLEAEAYRRLGRRMTLEAFVRHAPRIDYPVTSDWVWEDNWSGDAIFWLVENDPDEARALGHELWALSTDRGWRAIINAFIFEDLPERHGPR